MATTSGSFWERRPWAGFAIFGGVVTIVGTVLALVVGERPHYRRVTWPLVTELPAQGELMAGPWNDDPIRIRIRVRTTDLREQPLAGVECILQETSSGTVIARGVTSAPYGHVVLPVPVRFDRPLFSGDLEVIALTPRERKRVVVEKPKDGETIALLKLADSKAVKLQVLTGRGRLFHLRGKIHVGAEGIKPNPYSKGVPIFEGEALISGLPANVPLTFRAELSGRAAPEVTVTIPKSQTDVLSVQMVAGAPQIRVQGRLTDSEGNPLSNRALSCCHSVNSKSSRPGLTEATTNDKGEFAFWMEAGANARCVITSLNRESIESFSVRAESTATFETWKLGDVSLAETNEVASGVILDDKGQPAPGATVVLERAAARDDQSTFVTAARANQQGRFRLHTSDSIESCRVAAYSEGQGARNLTALSIPATNLRLKLQTLGNLAGSVDIERASKVHVRLRPSAKNAAMITELALDLAVTEDFEFRQLAPGLYDLEVVTQAGVKRLISEIEVRPGRTVEDKRLKAINLP